MTRLFLSELYYCTLHLTKVGIPVQSATPTLQIMRNSDNKFLKPSTGNWNLTPTLIPLVEKFNGIYQYELDISLYYNEPQSYTLIYNNGNLQEIELINYERRNRARLV